MQLQVRAAGLTLPAVLAARAMVGLGEGVALPSMNNLVRLFPFRSGPLATCHQSGDHGVLTSSA